MDVLVISAVLVCFVSPFSPIPEIPLISLMMLVYVSLWLRKHDVSKIAVYFVLAFTHFLAGTYIVFYRKNTWIHVLLLVFVVVMNVGAIDFGLLDRAFDRTRVAEFVLIIACGAMAEPIWMILTSVAMHALLLIRSLPPHDVHDTHDLHEPILKQTPELA